MQFCVEVTDLSNTVIQIGAKLPNQEYVSFCGSVGESKPWDECLCLANIRTVNHFEDVSASICEKGNICDYGIGACKAKCTSTCAEGMQCVDAIATVLRRGPATSGQNKLCLENCVANASSCVCGNKVCSSEEHCVTLGEKKTCAPSQEIRYGVCKESEHKLFFGQAEAFLCLQKNGSGEFIFDATPLPKCTNELRNSCICKLSETEREEYCASDEKCAESGCIKMCESDADCPSKYCDTDYNLCVETCKPGIAERDCTYGEEKARCEIDKEYAKVEIGGKIMHLCENKLFYDKNLPTCTDGKILIMDIGNMRVAKCVSELPDFKIEEINHCLPPKFGRNCLCENHRTEDTDIYFYCAGENPCVPMSSEQGYACGYI